MTNGFCCPRSFVALEAIDSEVALLNTSQIRVRNTSLCNLILVAPKKRSQCLGSQVQKEETMACLVNDNHLLLHVWPPAGPEITQQFFKGLFVYSWPLIFITFFWLQEQPFLKKKARIFGLIYFEDVFILAFIWPLWPLNHHLARQAWQLPQDGTPKQNYIKSRCCSF